MVSRRHAIKNKMSMSLEMRITFMIKMWTKVRITMGKGTRTRLRRSIRMGIILGNEDEIRISSMRMKARMRTRLEQNENEGNDEDEMRMRTKKTMGIRSEMSIREDELRNTECKMGKFQGS